MNQRPSKFMLITASPPLVSFTFKYFPTNIKTNGRANWEALDVSSGMKPLQYSNRDPLRFTIDDALLDESDTNRSLRDEVEWLLRLLDISEGETVTTWSSGRYEIGGVRQYGARSSSADTPPILLLAYGDNLEAQRRVVLEEIQVTEEMFAPDGNLIRVRLSLTFVEIQHEAPQLQPTRLGRFQSS
ncbi:MAG: hypothetical protein WCF57_09405 [Pyrinomonadaceae bacterium]